MFVATMLVAVFPGSGSVPLSPAVTTSLALLLYALPGVAVGALLGTAFARTIGSRRVWIGGCLGGFVLGAMSIAMLASDLTLRGITFT